jgi:alpha-glucosidase (family GH31 glycosyl hydrolase)
MEKRLIAETAPQTPKKAQIILGNVRLSVLAPGLLRAEKSANGTFLDQATQIVWYRNFSCPFTKEEDGTGFLIHTAAAAFHFNRRKEKIDYVILDGARIPADNRKNLKGTARTLDFKIFSARLQDGIIGKNGVAVMKDNSLVLCDDGLPGPRPDVRDEYIFASVNPVEALRSFYAITGFPPMIPRFALGNWWSRYYAYRQEEYLALMDRFAKEDLPFTVATMDMDWHWTDVRKRFGFKPRPGERTLYPAGWTGYSWNTELFPDYKAFLKALHDRGMKTTLNLHPAGGVRWFEDMYPAMCEAMGMDPSEKTTVPFDITNAGFIEAYFRCLHEPYEEDGVDFWWIDWQQGRRSALKGLDPLWALNHYHTLNGSRGNRIPLILSRYAGLGSHRYPLGFSGDAAVNWTLFGFEVYFTANAANVGYTFWSHDIGGHHMGRLKNDELYLRWVQFGVFSPVLRLHSTKHALSKEPWNHPSVCKIAGRFLRLRHSLIPYLYTMCRRTATEGRALCEPLYYNHPHNLEAYRYKKEYYFGTELIAAPVTKPAKKSTGLAETELWLPDGEYINIFTGEKLSGGKHTVLSGPDSLPVYAKAGAILPMSLDDGNGCGNPVHLLLRVFAGEGVFTLYEDAGDASYRTGNFVTTRITVSQKDGVARVVLEPSCGNAALIPEGRIISFEYNGAAFAQARILEDGKDIRFEQKNNTLTFICHPISKTEIILQ